MKFVKLILDFLRIFFFNRKNQIKNDHRTKIFLSADGCGYHLLFSCGGFEITKVIIEERFDEFGAFNSIYECDQMKHVAEIMRVQVF